MNSAYRAGQDYSINMICQHAQWNGEHPWLLVQSKQAPAMYGSGPMCVGCYVTIFLTKILSPPRFGFCPSHRAIHSRLIRLSSIAIMNSSFAGQKLATGTSTPRLSKVRAHEKCTAQIFPIYSSLSSFLYSQMCLAKKADQSGPSVDVLPLACQIQKAESHVGRKRSPLPSIGLRISPVLYVISLDRCEALRQMDGVMRWLDVRGRI